MTDGDALAGDERHQVEPVRADVADGAQRAAALGLEPPVPVALEEQPVLEVAAGDEADVAELAAGDDLVRVLVERVVADVEVDRVDETRPRAPRRPARRDSAAVIASGFSQTTCLPAAQDRRGPAGRAGRWAR